MLWNEMGFCENKTGVVLYVLKKAAIPVQTLRVPGCWVSQIFSRHMEVVMLALRTGFL